MKKAALTLIIALTSLPATAAHVKVIIPIDPNIQPNGDFQSPYHLDSRRWGTDTRQEKIIVLDKGNGDMFVNRRVDNGTAGSGRLFHLTATQVTGEKDTALTFATTDEPPYEYREGLFGRFPLPDFSDEDLATFLASGYIEYKFEINSDFPAESINANFTRLANGRPTRNGGNVGEVQVNGVSVKFLYNVMPYRNGSKATIEADLKINKAENGVVDFRPWIDQMKAAVTAVVSS